MIPKLKAKELFEKFLQSDEIDNHSFVGHLVAKQCALIAVNEILQVLDNEGYEDEDHKFKFWQQVQQEIEKI